MSTPSAKSLGAAGRRRVSPRGREGLLWAIGFVLLTVFSWLIYLLTQHGMRPSPGSLAGVAFGIAAAVLFVAAAAYSLRRRLMGPMTRWRLGRTRSWLYLHIYGGLFFLVLVTLHSAFRWPTGAASWTLWLLSWWTVLTGLLGLALQRWIPRVLASLSVEINAARIPQMVQELRQRVESLVAASGDPVRKLASRSIAPGLEAPRRSWTFFIDPSRASSAFPLEEIAYLRRLSGDDDGRRLEELEKLLVVKHELDVHYTLQHALRVWLVVHLPASWLLLVAILVHIFSVLYY